MKNIGRCLSALALVILASGSVQAEPNFDNEFDKPITFTLGRFASTDDCGPRCADFIVGRGEVTSLAYVKLLIAHTRAGSRPIPLILHSHGGELDVARHLGRMFKQLDLTVIVARAEAEPCTGTCASSEVKPYSLTAKDAGCASACTLAIAAAPTRIVPEGASVGVHMPTLAPNILGLKEKGKFSKDIIESLVDDMELYFTSMGISKDIIPLLRSAKSDDMRWLTRDEMIDVGLIKPGEHKLLQPSAR